MLALFMSVVWAGCSAFLKNNEAYERGLATALADSTVNALLGAPVTEGWFLNGTIESEGGGTRGDWTTRLRGDVTSGTLGIVGAKRGDRWGVTSLTLWANDLTYSYVPGQGFLLVDTDVRPAFDILPK